jgi:uncharacterized protein YggE
MACSGDKEDLSQAEPEFIETGVGRVRPSGAAEAPEIVRSSSGGGISLGYPAAPGLASAVETGGLTVSDKASAVVPADEAFAVVLVPFRPVGPLPPAATLPARQQAEVLTALQAQGFAREDVIFETSSVYGPFATVSVRVPVNEVATAGKKAIDAVENITGRGESSGARFGLKDCVDALGPLRKEALEGAGSKAKAIAADASLTLGPLVAVSERAPAPIVYGPPQTDPCAPADSFGKFGPGSALSALDATPEVNLSLEMTLTYSLGGSGGEGVSATGTGRATAKANEAYIVIITVPGVPSGPFGGQALSKKQRDDVIAKLKALKIDEDDIDILAPSLGGGQTIISVETGIDNLQQRGKEITTAVEDVVGRSQQQGVIFSHSNCEAVLAEARKQALTDAKRRVDALAAAASLKLGQMVALSEPIVPSGPPDPAATVCDQDPVQMLNGGIYGAIVQSFDAEPLLTVSSRVNVSYSFTGP